MQLRHHRIVAGNHKFSLRFSVFACFWVGGGGGGGGGRRGDASQKESINWNIQRDLGDREGSIKKKTSVGVLLCSGTTH